MMSNIRSTYIFAIGEVLSKGLAFLLLPLAGLLMPVSEFNQFALYIPSVQLLATVFTFGLPNYLLHLKFHDADLYNTRASVYIALSMVFNFVLFILILISSFVTQSESGANLALFFAAVATTGMINLYVQKFYIDGSMKIYLIQNTGSKFFYVISLSILFWMSTIEYHTFLVSYIVVNCFFLVLCRPHLSFRLTPARELLNFAKFCIPVILQGAFQFFIYINSRYFIDLKENPKEFAIFSILQTFQGLFALFTTVFLRTYLLKLFQSLKRMEDLSDLRRNNSLAIKFFILFVPIFYLVSQFYFYMNSSIDNSSQLVYMLPPFFILASFFYMISMFLTDILLYHGKTGNLFLINLAMTLFSLLASVAGKYIYGTIGIATGLLATQIFSMGIVFYFTKDYVLKLVPFGAVGRYLIIILLIAVVNVLFSFYSSDAIRAVFNVAVGLFLFFTLASHVGVSRHLKQIVFNN